MKKMEATDMKSPSIMSCAVAGGFAGQAIAADHEFTLEPHLVVLIRRLLLFKAFFGLNLAIWFGRSSLKWAEDDFTLRPRMLLGSKFERLGDVRGGGAKPVPRDRISGCGGTTVSRRTAICQHQRGHKECNAFWNHGDSFDGEAIRGVIGEKPTLARRHIPFSNNEQRRETSLQRQGGGAQYSRRHDVLPAKLADDRVHGSRLSRQ
jgi:hypothetical protein